MNSASDNPWQQSSGSKRPFTVLLVAAAAVLLALAIVRGSSRPRPVGIDAILEYEILEVRRTIHSGSSPIIYFFKSLGDLRASNGEDYSYVPSTRLTLEATGPQVQLVQDWIVEQVNSSQQHARDLIFDDRLVVRYVTLEAIDREAYKKVDNRLADHVYDVLSELADERDPFIAGAALHYLIQANEWRLPAFKAAINHPLAVIRGQAIYYARRMEKSLTAEQCLEMMTAASPALADPHIGIRQLVTRQLRSMYLKLCESLPSGSPARAKANALQLQWVSHPDEVVQDYLKGARADVEAWQERVTALRGSLQ